MTTTRAEESRIADPALDTSSPESPLEFVDPFAGKSETGDMTGTSPGGLSPPPRKDRRLSKEWDAAKVPPSRFQKPEGSIYATTNSRDGHIDRKERDQGYHDKLKAKGWGE